MKKNDVSKSRRTLSGELRPEYRFDYRKARPNRFAARMSESSTIVILDSDVAEVFTTSEAVNTVLRALIATMPKTSKAKMQRLMTG